MVLTKYFRRLYLHFLAHWVFFCSRLLGTLGSLVLMVMIMKNENGVARWLSVHDNNNKQKWEIHMARLEGTLLIFFCWLRAWAYTQLMKHNNIK